MIRTLFPFLDQLKGYGREDLGKDLTAGLTLALVLIPQSMANAQLAGLPAWHGLYAALIPAVVGGLWGSSRHMVTGIGAVVAIMAASALAQMPISGPADYIAHMALLTLIVGALQVLFGLLRLGALVNFLSHPVISGFINASAFIIAASQLGKLLGITIESTGSEIGNLFAVLSSARHFTHWPSVFMALVALAAIVLIRRFLPKVPAILAAVVLTTLLSWLVGFERSCTASLGQIASAEVQRLITRLNDDIEQAARAGEDILGMELEKPATQAQELQRGYLILDRQLKIKQTRSDASLVREHLRRLTFVSQLQEDGSRRFFVKDSPDPEHLAGKAIGPGRNASLSGRPAESSPVQQASPADDFLDGVTWRLTVGSRGLDPEKLRFSGGGEVVGSIPAGLPHFFMPVIDAGQFLRLFPQALIIAFVAFAESISIAKGAAAQLGYRLDPNRQMVGLGLANLSGGLVLTCPVSGSFSASAVNLSAGGRSGLSSLFAGLGALLVLLFLTPLLYYLPQPVLAVIVMIAVTNLIRFSEFKQAWKARREDGVIAVVTFCATLFFAPHMDYGIAVGIVLSLASYFYRSMHPRIAALSVGPDNLLRNAKVFGLDECRHIAIIHFQGSLFFANASVLENYILDRLERQKELRHIHFVCSGMNSIDASGEESLAMLIDQAHQAGVRVSFSGVLGPVADVLDRMGVLRSLGKDNYFLTPREAVCAIYHKIQHDEGCTDCPLTNIFCHERERRHQKTPCPGAAEDETPAREKS